MKMMLMTSIKWFFIFIATRYQDMIFTSGACIDTHRYCALWASKGQCQKNYLYMLQKCPQSCQVCSGGVSCVNKYNDAYCRLHAGNCWRQSYAKNLINNCAKTCVCSCCPTSPGTTPTNATLTTPTTPTTTATATTTKVKSTKVSTTPQTTTEKTGDEKTTLIPLSTQKVSVAKETNTTTTNSYNSRQDSAEKTQKSEFDTVLLLAIIAGTVVVIGILGLLLFYFWRRKRSGSLQTPRESPPSTEFPQISDTKTMTNAPIYHVLEGPNNTSPRKDQALSVHYERSSKRFRSEFPQIPDTESMTNAPIYHVLEEPNNTSPRKDQALSVHYEQSAEKFRSESDYDDRAQQGMRAMIGSSSSARENDTQYETVDKVRNPKRFMHDISNCPTLDNSVEYCYSYNVANRDLSLEVRKNRQHEVPNEQGPRYHVLERPNNGYQSLERSQADGAYKPTRNIEPSNYQDLDKTTQSFYHPLKKKD